MTLTSTLALWLLLAVFLPSPTPQARPAEAQPPRVIVSTDIGGTDPDDFQSMVHFLVYADRFDVEGIVSSPYGPGRKEHILQVIDRYATDYANLTTYSPRYPTPDALRRVTKQGAIDSGAPARGRATEGSNWIVQSARRNDSRPLWLLVWGGIDDLAQALHDAPDILPKLRVYFIGGPNKMWSAAAYDYIEQQHPSLWLIEANATYRGWFTGGDQSGEWDNTAFVTTHIAGRGALGTFFATQLKGTVKMGDTPAVMYALGPTRDDPTQPGWGGQFVRVWDDRKTIFTRHTTQADTVEAFGTVEYVLPLPAGDPPRDHDTRMIFDGRVPIPAVVDGRVLRFRFSPRDAKSWSYVVRSAVPALDGASGHFTAVPPPPERTRRASTRHPHWWIDDPAPASAEGIHPGAKTVNRWRQAFLSDFAARMLRCEKPAQ